MLEISAKQQATWNKLVIDVISKSRGADKAAPVPDAPANGTYIKFAFNNQGMLSSGRIRGGKKHRHWSPKMNALKSLALEIFRQEFTDALRAELIDAAREGRKSDGVGPQETAQIYFNSMKEAEKRLGEKWHVARRNRRRRQNFSARVNAGLAFGTMDRRSVAAGAPTWIDIRRVTQVKYKAQPKPNVAQEHGDNPTDQKAA